MTVEPVRPYLTPRQSKALRFITEHVAQHGFPPSVRQIGNEVGLKSTSSVHHVLTRLEWKGYLRKTGNVSRGVQVLDPPEPRVERCPHCGGDVNETGGTA